MIDFWDLSGTKLHRQWTQDRKRTCPHNRVLLSKLPNFCRCVPGIEERASLQEPCNWIYKCTIALHCLLTEDTCSVLSSKKSKSSHTVLPQQLWLQFSLVNEKNMYIDWLFTETCMHVCTLYTRMCNNDFTVNSMQYSIVNYTQLLPNVCRPSLWTGSLNYLKIRDALPRIIAMIDLHVHADNYGWVVWEVHCLQLQQCLCNWCLNFSDP